ncbi:MAG TPA: aconitate hydratase [candidate division Zixibacteria bacterium]|nr:aconitate hydratase [candidate division Zixibacteria bacterium]
MAQNAAQKIIGSHLADGQMKPGAEIAVKIDQNLLQDATGTMAWLEFEALGVPRVKSRLAVSYVDHNMLQTGFENPDDHLFLQTMSAKYGALLSRPGNGISHHAHLERFDVPGETLLGADSHTCQAGAMGMLAIGAGGFEVAATMAGEPYRFRMPQIVRVVLKGELPPWVSANDVILELLRRYTVKGGLNKIYEYAGPGLAKLTVAERSTIANMGAELGLTASVFPSDEQTLAFLKWQRRDKDFKPLAADEGAKYDDEIELDLSKLEPLIAQPHSPDKVVPVREIAGTPVRQVAVGSSVNSSFFDLMTVAEIMKGKKVHPNLHMTVSPGSRQVLLMFTLAGGLASVIAAGARGLEVACGPCIGMGMAPPSGGNSVRTFNRNFPGRSGTADDRVYLCSPEVAAATAIHGVITDPRTLGNPPKIEIPKELIIDDSGFLPPAKEGEKVEIVRGPNIQPLPPALPMAETIFGVVLIKLKDNISTDEIMPAGAKILPLRSNIPAIAEYVFHYVDPGFPARAKAKGTGIIVARENYGQGSSREHAAIAPMYLGVRAVVARSFARIHHDNLINFGLVPLRFTRPEDYDSLAQDDQIEIIGVRTCLKEKEPVKIRNLSKNKEAELSYELTARQIEILLAGGLVNHLRR